MAVQPLYMDAVITPNRSLSKRGLWVLLGVLGVYNLVVGVFLLAIGAFPVPIFLGVDFAGVWLAFHISNRRARNAERVQVSAQTVEVLRRNQTVWSSPTAFTRVTLEDRAVALRLSGRSLDVARVLSPRERTAFAEALERAIAAAKRERYAPA
ncbi:MAG: hypothetical protein B7Y99_01180 [Caulobacterales bacterium 32-69-10]|nr:MAG: hypothetical protein B7Y99_01180 [Caulobacterales bacterium 32-69-10]